QMDVVKFVIRQFESSRPSHIAVRGCSLEFDSVHELLKRRRKSSRIGPQASAPGLLKPTNLTVSMTVRSGHAVTHFGAEIPSWLDRYTPLQQQADRQALQAERRRR